MGATALARFSAACQSHPVRRKQRASQSAPPAPMDFPATPATAPDGDYPARSCNSELRPESSDRLRQRVKISHPTPPASCAPCREIPCCAGRDKPESRCSRQATLAMRRARQTASCWKAASKREFGRSCSAQLVVSYELQALGSILVLLTDHCSSLTAFSSMT